jgi:hypothetical protein
MDNSSRKKYLIRCQSPFDLLIFCYSLGYKESGESMKDSKFSPFYDEVRHNFFHDKVPVPVTHNFYCYVSGPVWTDQNLTSVKKNLTPTLSWQSSWINLWSWYRISSCLIVTGTYSWNVIVAIIFFLHITKFFCKILSTVNGVGSGIRWTYSDPDPAKRSGSDRAHSVPVCIFNNAARNL